MATRKKSVPPPFDAQSFAKTYEEEAMRILSDNLHHEDGMVQNDAAHRMVQIANEWVTVQ